MNYSDITLLIYCGHTLVSQNRSGIQRVVIEATKALGRRCNVHLVIWDTLDGQLRYADQYSINKLFPQSENYGIKASPYAYRVSYRFGDTISNPDKTWLLFPEIAYHITNGNDIFARIISQTREYGLKLAAIFYDLIPIHDDEYSVARKEHLQYLAELLKFDLIFPISHFAGSDLIDYLRRLDIYTPEQIAILKNRVQPINLGENLENEPWGLLTRQDQSLSSHIPHMIMVGTIEPRKQQTIFLKILNDVAEINPDLKNLVVDVFGSLHPACSDALHTECARNPNIHYHHYVSDAEIESAYSRAWFSVFPSRHEGFGLPIVESLRRGVPCITANFGAMSEVADGGGCLTVNVHDHGELAKALLSMYKNQDIREKLKHEITLREPRPWGRYADHILSYILHISQSKQDSENAFKEAFRSALASSHVSDSIPLKLGDVVWSIFQSQDAPIKLPPANTNDASTETAPFNGAMQARLSLLAPNALASNNRDGNQARLYLYSDILIADQEADLTTLLNLAEENSIRLNAPYAVFTGANRIARSIEEALRISRKRNNAIHLARNETLYSTFMSHLYRQQVQEASTLAIVISTYNRGPFVSLNIGRLLSMLDKEQLDVKCIVVDNASTDNTHELLSVHFGHPKFTYIRNPANVGMLGNLRVCSALSAAKYVWITGDDDFIYEGAIQRTLDEISSHPGVPMLFHNFCVYHRQSISTADSARIFFSEAIPLAKNSIPSGLYPVNVIAEQHDNLFTAIYPIIFRADVLAACFNYPFDGIPFGDLVECVPTTKLILDSFRYSQGYWFAEPGILGNAHNSWSSHRPRWHLVLMPLIFDLAREAGVDPQKIWDWSKTHTSLFKEAVEIAIRAKSKVNLVPDDMKRAKLFFREDIVIPESLRLDPNPGLPIWESP